MELDALVAEWRKGLEGVTPGPWNVEYGESGNGPDRRPYALLIRTEDEWPTGVETGEVHCITGSPIMEHIARCSPENISTLLDALEAERSKLVRLEEALRPFAAFAEHIAKERPGWDHDAFAFGGPLKETKLTMADFRRARSALSHSSSKGESRE